MTRLSPLFSRLAALGVSLALLAALWFGIAAPISGAFAEMAAERDRLVAVKARYRRAAANIDALRAQRDDLQSSRADSEDLLNAPSAAAAAAIMQGDVKRAVIAAGGEVRRVQVAPAEPGADAEKIQLRVLATMDLAGLGALLTALEIEDRRYRVGDLRAEPDRKRRGADEDGRLTVRFELYGFRARPAEARPGAPLPASSAAPGFRRLGDG